jgi:hypothetical protein
MVHMIAAVGSRAATIDGETLWSHVDAACNIVVFRDFDSLTLNPCQIYWKNKELF